MECEYCFWEINLGVDSKGFNHEELHLSGMWHAILREGVSA